jgi:LmbE family N-acetylglucosaminyl deacetylase
VNHVLQSDNLRVLALLPHPDDIEILCVGTLIRLRDRGYEIHYGMMTPGDKGSAVHTRQEIADIRREEGRKASEAIGAASFTCLEFEDLSITFDNDARRRVAGLVRKVDPFMVFTTPPSDYMFDHEITSWLVRDACFNASVPNYETPSNEKPASGVPYLYYTDAVEGHDLFGRESPVSCIVDISSTIDQKANALMQHDSQRSWLQKQHGMDNYIESMKTWSAKRGQQAGFEYGEAFCQHLGHPHPQDNLLADLLNAKIISS